jgi:hypothetical protein
LTRRIIGIVFVVASLTGFLVPEAHAAPRQHPQRTAAPVLVKISRAPARIGADGSVPVVVFARCRAGLNAFELDVSVQQGAASGSESILGPGVTPCDGRWHRSAVRVSPDAGSFAAGAATVDVFLGAFDPVEGDLEATDTGSVTLLPPFACRVKNTTQDTWFATEDGAALTNAIAAAGAGDQLNVFGTCVGIYVIDKDLNISGSHSLVFPTTLDAAGQGRVLYVPVGPTSAPTVTLDHLIITGGNDTTPGGGGGLLVSEGATVTLSRSLVTGNTTTFVGGGIVNGGSLTLNTTLVSRNHAVLDDGGGIYNFGDLVVNGSWVTSNSAVGAGGGIFNEGVAILNSSRVRFNTAGNAGGVLNVNLITLNSSDISSNVPDDCEGC